MANNRLAVFDKSTGEAFFIAKGWGNGWEVWATQEGLQQWLGKPLRDGAAGLGAADTSLILITEESPEWSTATWPMSEGANNEQVAGDAQPAGDAAMPVAADDLLAFERWLRSVWTDGYACRKTEDGRYVHGEAQRFLECFQAGLAQRDARITNQKAALIELTAENERWAKECNDRDDEVCDRIERMAKLSAQAKHAEDCLDAAKERIAALEAQLAAKQVAGMGEAALSDAVVTLQQRVAELEAQRVPDGWIAVPSKPGEVA